MRNASALLFAALLLATPLSAAERFGAPLKGATMVALDAIIKTPDAYAGKTIETEGPIAAVCTKKGCWMTLGDADRSVRVTFKDYGFFVPKNITGGRAVLEGTFRVETIPEATAKHYAGETPGGKPEAIRGDQKELSFVATGVEITRPAK